MSPLRRCPRRHCGGAVLFGTCHLCGRSPDAPPPPAPRQSHRRRQREAPPDPLAAVAKAALDLSDSEVQELMQPPAPIRYSLRAAVAPSLEF